MKNPRPTDRHSMGADYVPKTVKEGILKLLYESPTPLRFTDIMNGLQRPNRTVYVSLKELDRKKFVSAADHRYSLTADGKTAFERTEAIERFSRSLVTPGGERIPALSSDGGQWIWVPQHTLEALEARSKIGNIPVWSVIDAALGFSTKELWDQSDRLRSGSGGLMTRKAKATASAGARE